VIINIAVLTFNDLYISLKNKSFFLVIFIPLFVFISMELVDKNDGKEQVFNIGLVSKENYDPDVLKSVTSAGHVINVKWLQGRFSGIDLLKSRVLDGVFVESEKSPGRMDLLVLNKESPQAQAILKLFSSLQKVEEGGYPYWIADVEQLQEGGIQKQSLPTWVLMLVLLVSFIIIPAQVAEEKEKKLLLALLQTPVSEIEWLLAKIISGTVLMLTALLLLHLSGEFGPVNLSSYIVFILVGSFCFSAFGVFLGFLCRNQASARTLGMIVYLPMLLPSALSDVSQKLTGVAPFLPSYQFYMPVRSILLYNGSINSVFYECIYLLLLGGLMFSLAYYLIKKRWLM
jgi:ABC-2 type transport system permease protein